MISKKSVSFSELVTHRCSDLKVKARRVDKRKKKLYFTCFISFLIIISVIIVFIVCFPSNNTINNSVPSNNSSSNDSLNDFNTECLKSHNYYRSIHGVQPMSLDPDLIKVAEKRAHELILTDDFNHPVYDFKFGENLHYIMPFVKNYSCPKIVEPWYDEIKDYDFSDWRKSKGKIGHFTQVVWKSTLRVGCAQAYSERSKRLYSVCNYSPPGNYINRYQQNVLIPMI